MYFYTAANGDANAIASHFYYNEVDAVAHMEKQNAKAEEMGLEARYEVMTAAFPPEGVNPR